VVTGAQLQRWRELMRRLRQGPGPHGELPDLCRRVLNGVPVGPERARAARHLLESGMAEAATDIADAQEIMRILKAVDHAEITIEQLLTAS